MDQKHKCSLPGCLCLHKATVKASSGAVAYPKAQHVGPTSEAAFLVPGRMTYLWAVGVRAPVPHCSWRPPSAPWQRPPPSSQKGRLPSEGKRDRRQKSFYLGNESLGSAHTQQEGSLKRVNPRRQGSLGAILEALDHSAHEFLSYLA